MAANVQPIWSRVADLQWISYATTANTTPDLTTGTNYLIFTADATNGGMLFKLRLHATPAGNTSATVMRIWINNGATTNTATNNILYTEITLPLINASSTAATADFEIPINIPLPAGYRVYATIHTASANGWAITGVGGKF